MEPGTIHPLHPQDAIVTTRGIFVNLSLISSWGGGFRPISWYQDVSGMMIFRGTLYIIAHIVEWLLFDFRFDSILQGSNGMKPHPLLPLKRMAIEYVWFFGGKTNAVLQPPMYTLLQWLQRCYELSEYELLGANGFCVEIFTPTLVSDTCLKSSWRTGHRDSDVESCVMSILWNFAFQTECQLKCLAWQGA